MIECVRTGVRSLASTGASDRFGTRWVRYSRSGRACRDTQVECFVFGHIPYPGVMQPLQDQAECYSQDISRPWPFDVDPHPLSTAAFLCNTVAPSRFYAAAHALVTDKVATTRIFTLRILATDGRRNSHAFSAALG